MPAMVRCKACGYIFQSGRFHHCPACGVPEKMFEPYEDKIPANRRRVLDMHIHPVVVHAPQALGFIILGIAAFLILAQVIKLQGQWITDLYTTLRWLTILLPVMVVGGLMTGLLDGKYRYKTVTSKLLVGKIVVGSLFLVLSLAMVVINFQVSFTTSLGLQIAYLLVNAGAFGCSVKLGLWGASLTGGIMGGPFTKKKKAGPSEPATKPSE